MKYYAVKKGYNPGIYTTWEACSKQVNGYSGAEFKRFHDLKEAEDFLNDTGYYALVILSCLVLSGLPEKVGRFFVQIGLHRKANETY